jgi:hypothetical protein
LSVHQTAADVSLVILDNCVHEEGCKEERRKKKDQLEDKRHGI